MANWKKWIPAIAGVLGVNKAREAEAGLYDIRPEGVPVEPYSFSDVFSKIQITPRAEYDLQFSNATARNIGHIDKTPFRDFATGVAYSPEQRGMPVPKFKPEKTRKYSAVFKEGSYPSEMGYHTISTRPKRSLTREEAFNNMYSDYEGENKPYKTESGKTKTHTHIVSGNSEQPINNLVQHETQHGYNRLKQYEYFSDPLKTSVDDYYGSLEERIARKAATSRGMTQQQMAAHWNKPDENIAYNKTARTQFPGFSQRVIPALGTAFNVLSIPSQIIDFNNMANRFNKVGLSDYDSNKSEEY